MAEAGEKIFEYRLQHRLGEGPFGEVWEAVDPEGRPVCCKLLKTEVAADPGAEASFARVEAAVRVHAQIDHPYVARAIAAPSDPERRRFAVISERSPGRSLARLDVSHAAQDGEAWAELCRLLFFFEELGEALYWVHRAGLVHGNLKPSNVIVQRGDFGLVPRLVDLSWSAFGVEASSESTYISPEQFAGRVPTAASDQWSYGTLITRMLTSKRPDRSFGAVPERLIDALQRCRAREPQARFPSMRQAVDEVRAARSALERGEAVAHRQTTRSDARRAHEPPVPEARSLTIDTGDVEDERGPKRPKGSGSPSPEESREATPTVPFVPLPPASVPSPPPAPSTAARPWDVDPAELDFRPKPGRWLLLAAAAVLVGVGAALWLAPIPEDESVDANVIPPTRHDGGPGDAGPRPDGRGGSGNPASAGGRGR